MKNYNHIMGLNTIILFLLVYSCPVHTQTKPNSIYFEALGNGGLYSVNYDRLFTENFGGRVGVMYLSTLDFFWTSIDNILLIPAILNYFVGTKHKLELGGGIVFASVGSFGFESGSGASNVVGTAVIGYRYQKPEGGFLFRAGFTPLFNSEGVEPWGGISLGFSF